MRLLCTNYYYGVKDIQKYCIILLILFFSKSAWHQLMVIVKIDPLSEDEKINICILLT